MACNCADDCGIGCTACAGCLLACNMACAATCAVTCNPLCDEECAAGCAILVETGPIGVAASIGGADAVPAAGPFNAPVLGGFGKGTTAASIVAGGSGYLGAKAVGWWYGE